MIRFFASHPTAANILMFVILMLGIAALPDLNRETFPEVNPYQVQVSVTYPGANASEVEEGICNRLEDATDGISYLEERSCRARDNVGVMVLDMFESGDMKQFLDDVRAEVDTIVDFPDDAEDPVIEELGRTSPVLNVAIRADLTPPELKALAEFYRIRMLNLAEVPMVEVQGFSDHELSIRIDAETLRRYRLSIQDIANLVSRQALDLPSGILESEQRWYQIRVENQRRSIAELSDLVVLTDELGGQLQLGDIATIHDEFSDPELRSELDGHPAAFLLVSKNRSDDTLTVFNAVRDFVEAENAQLPDSTRERVQRLCGYFQTHQDRMHYDSKVLQRGRAQAFLAQYQMKDRSYQRTSWHKSRVRSSFSCALKVDG